MTTGEICTVAGTLATAGGVLIYIGRSLGALDSIKKAVEVALSKTDRHDLDITDLKSRLARVETKQEDCGNCP